MNEEDIKLVESLIKEFKTYNDLDGIQDLSPYMKAIENIINRNKEIEEDYTSVYLSGFYNGENKWKSKVEEKIEELKGLEFGTDLVTQSTANLTTICILNKLLEK